MCNDRCVQVHRCIYGIGIEMYQRSHRNGIEVYVCIDKYMDLCMVLERQILVHMSVYTIHISMKTNACAHLYIHVYVSIYMYIHICIQMRRHLPTHMSIQMSMHMSILIPIPMPTRKQEICIRVPVANTQDSYRLGS